eukprot:TRINITY_DN3702_c0_g3_i3.p1 TRINITY_DN3702_c0_g3~~TRINITY_DN3702_c0_g3_i3.p1  ORF type:complete len:137 (+),score=14.99 TRINITY_DN3702_c0_g3_i3:372-782(+)
MIPSTEINQVITRINQIFPSTLNTFIILVLCELAFSALFGFPYLISEDYMVLGLILWFAYLFGLFALSYVLFRRYEKRKTEQLLHTLKEENETTLNPLGLKLEFEMPFSLDHLKFQIKTFSSDEQLLDGQSSLATS